MTSSGGAARPAQAADASASRSSTQLLQEAKRLKAGLKALLDDSKGAPSSSEIEFARRNLRNTLLNLLFGHPYTRESQGVDTFLWIETTHPLVSAYRAQLSELKKRLSGPNAGSDKSAPNKAARKLKAAEYQKTLIDFRKFLSAESIFWQEVAGRVTRAFGLDEARHCLAELEIPCDEDAPDEVRRARAFGRATEEFDRNGRGSTAAESDTLKQQALQPSNRERLLEVVHRSLIYCGDLARYLEMYADARKPAAPAEKDGKGRRQGKGGNSPKPQYSGAIACYEQARALLPHKGNPSNQIAVVAMYSHNFFDAVYHYYRALCVKVPFETARANLDSAMRKVLTSWSQSDATSREGKAKRVDAWIRDFVALHAMFYLRKE